MRLLELRVENFRAFASLEFVPGAGLNLLTGANGAGKTSVLEAVYLLSHGRSFRSPSRDVLVREGSAGLAVFGKLLTGSGVARRVGLERVGTRWLARLDGVEPKSLTELLRACAVVCFEPGSHALISGAASERRAFLDWGLFHVEPDFVPVWRRHRRALKQRNALLKQAPRPDELAPWDIELASADELLCNMRRRYFCALAPFFEALSASFLGELGAMQTTFSSGWADGVPLLEVFSQSHGRDLARGFTGSGAHRGDWAIGFERAVRREHLSRGQEKLCALACLLAQAQHYAAVLGEFPVVCLDDLASELDQAHQAIVVAALQGAEQVLVTGTDVPVTFESALGQGKIFRFHVEHGSMCAV